MIRHAILIASLVEVSFLLIGCEPMERGNAPSPSETWVLPLEELTYPEIDQLDRDKAVFLLTFGNLEEHGPHLPVGSDYFQAAGLRDGLIAQLHESHPEYTFVLLPIIPLGEGGFNDVARQFDHIGTLGVRFSTLRDVAIDVGSGIARHGFQNIFLIHFHGAPLHNVAFTQAAAFVSERYDVRMVNITSLVFATGIFSPAVISRHLGENWEEELGLAIHAGPGETSTTLYLRGDLVKPDYRTLPAFPVMGFDELGLIHEREGFQGYANDPSRASVQLGEDIMNDVVARATEIAEKALAGDDLSSLPVYPDVLPMSPELGEMIGLVQERYSQMELDIATRLDTESK